MLRITCISRSRPRRRPPPAEVLSNGTLSLLKRNAPRAARRAAAPIAATAAPEGTFSCLASFFL
jgi:hypothetical protein